MHFASADDVPDQTGRVAVVTGANSGIGFEAALALARKGAQVVLACRSEERGREALDKVLADAPGANASLQLLDLGSLASVRAFAAAFLESHERLDLLVNNAGVMAMPERVETKDKLEAQLGVNHMGHFLLTALLLPALRKSSDARVVNVSSEMHRVVRRIDFDDLNAEKSYSKWSRYGQSKLANLLFTFALDRRFKQAGLPIKAVACHPGYSATALQRHHGWFQRLNGYLAQSSAMGALPTLMAATDPSMAGGEFVGPRLIAWGRPRLERPSGAARNVDMQERLWSASERVVDETVALPAAGPTVKEAGAALAAPAQ